MPKVQSGHDVSPGRLGRSRRVSSSLSEINVVPMVDVMLVLLIIFMVAAPMIQRGVDVNLPVAKNTPQLTAERVEITVPLAYRQNHTVFMGNEAIKSSVLQERVRQKMEHAAQKDVYLRLDGGLSVNEAMDVTDLLKGAGVEHVGLITKPAGR